MTHCLDIAGLILNSIGATTLGVCSTANVFLMPNGSVSLGGDPNLDPVTRTRKNIRRYKMQRYGMPAGWTLFVIGFALQFAALMKW